ncbi:MAG: hypothetical protein ACLUIO_23555 [Neglectibacter timonensis]
MTRSPLPRRRRRGESYLRLPGTAVRAIHRRNPLRRQNAAVPAAAVAGADQARARGQLTAHADDRLSTPHHVVTLALPNGRAINSVYEPNDIRRRGVSDEIRCGIEQREKRC